MEFCPSILLTWQTNNLKLWIKYTAYQYYLSLWNIEKRELAETKLYHSEKKSTNILLLNQHKKEEERDKNCKIEIERMLQVKTNIRYWNWKKIIKMH